MLKIGLTGGIGSGKSTVAKIFAALGIPVLDADTTAKYLMQHDENLKTKLVDTFGKDVYIEGILNKPYLAQKVFDDKFALEQLNTIVHPATIDFTNQWALKQTAPYIIKEAALMFEAGSTNGLDKIIGVSAPVSLRINRVLKRDNTTREAVLQRINNQISDTIKMKLCDFVLINNDQQMLLPQVIALHQQFLKVTDEKS